MPRSMQVLSGSALKLLACVFMLIDHVGAHILRHFAWAMDPLFTIMGENWTWYSLSRGIGRLAFPIYCFLLVEGFGHTRNRVKYGRNLLAFALISELPWNYVHTGKLFCASQNVFFTLFFGYLAWCLMDYFKQMRLLQLICALAILVITLYFRADYGWKGYLFLLIMYGLHYDPVLQAMVGGAWLLYEWKAVFAFLPINMYNGRRGFIRGKWLKYVFYAYYPLHMLILGYIKYNILA